jgi:hypothetical protein
VFSFFYYRLVVVPLYRPTMYFPIKMQSLKANRVSLFAYHHCYQQNWDESLQPSQPSAFSVSSIIVCTDIVGLMTIDP